MATDVVVYGWVCPVCGIERMSLADRSSAAVEAQAENAIRSHVENSDGGGHAAKGQVPPDFPDGGMDSYVRMKETFGGRRATRGRS